MTKDEAIKFLQQLYPNGGHCWLDEQRIEAIGMAVKTLQEEPVKIKKGCKYRCLSDMVNRDTGNISFIGDKIYLAPEDDTLVSDENGWLCDTSEDASNFELVEEPVSEDLGEYINELSKQFPEVSFAKLSRIAVRVAKWQAEQMMAKAIDGKVIANGMGNPILHLWDKGRHFIGKKVKVIVIDEC